MSYILHFSLIFLLFLKINKFSLYDVTVLPGGTLASGCFKFMTANFQTFFNFLIILKIEQLIMKKKID